MTITTNGTFPNLYTIEKTLSFLEKLSCKAIKKVEGNRKLQ